MEAKKILPPQVTFILLEKNGRLAALQGMSHIAPARFYKMIQKDLNQAASQGARIFFEGPGEDRTITLSTRKAKRLEWYLENIGRKAFKAAGRHHRLATQYRLKYPASARMADISMQEIANKGAELGVPYSWFLHLMYSVPFRHMLPDGSIDKDRLPWWFKTICTLGGERFLEWFEESMSRVMPAWDPIILDYRNTKIFQRIQQSGGGRDLFLLYGELHVPALAELFRADGWEVTHTRILKMSDFIDVLAAPS